MKTGSLMAKIPGHLEATNIRNESEANLIRQTSMNDCYLLAAHLSTQNTYASHTQTDRQTEGNVIGQLLVS